MDDDTTTTGGMAAIEDKARLLRRQRNLIGRQLAALNEEIAEARGRHLEVLRDLAAAARQTTDELLAECEARDDLFADQRSITLHQLKFGFRKQRDRLEWGDDAQVVLRIKQVFEDEIGVLVRVTEKPHRAALAKLDAADLARIGVRVVELGDEVFVSDVASDVDKAVDKLISEQAAAAP